MFGVGCWQGWGLLRYARETASGSKRAGPGQRTLLPPYPILPSVLVLPRSLFEGALPVVNWEALAGRPCLVALANLWLHRVSSRAPQLD